MSEPSSIDTSALAGLEPWIRLVQTEDFLFRAPAHAVDAQRGLGIIWLASNDEWKKRVTERLSIPRIDTLDTTLLFDVDIAQIMRHGLPTDQRDTYWLPLLSSRRDSPSVLEVLDENGDRVPRLTTAEVRWYLAAGLAQLLVRTQPERAVQNCRRDVELLLSAAIRRCFTASLSDIDRGSASEGPEATGVEIVRIDAEHDRRRTRGRLAVAKAAVEDATWEAREVPRLVDALKGRRLLVVECNSSDVRESYECRLPSRQLEPLQAQWDEPSVLGDPLQPEANTTPDPWWMPARVPDVPKITRFAPRPSDARLLARARVMTRAKRSGTRSKLLDWLRREGPACGRAGLDIELIADAAAANYHVVLDLPEGTQVAPSGMVSAPFLEMRLDTQEIARRLRREARRFDRLVALRRADLDAAGIDGDGPRDRAWEIQVDRVAAEVSTAASSLRNLLRSVSSEVEDLDIPAVWDDLQPALDRVVSTTEWIRRSWDKAAFDNTLAWASPTEPLPLGADVDDGGLSLAAQCRYLVTRMPHEGEARVTKRYRQRDEGHPDRVHIAVPSADRAPRTIPAQSARLRAGVYLVEPLPHTTTNLANALNTGMILLTGAVIAVSAIVSAIQHRAKPVPIEMSAVVAILILFAGVQAARIERPDRTTLRGWLSRMPFVLGFVSPIPSAFLAVWVAGGGVAWAEGWARAGLVVGVFGLAATGQLLLVAIGIHAGREAEMWDYGPRRRVAGPPGESASTEDHPPGSVAAGAAGAGPAGELPLTFPSVLLPRFVRVLLEHVRRALVARRLTVHPSERRPDPIPGDPNHRLPRLRLLGELARWLAPAGFWITPAIRSTGPLEDEEEGGPDDGIAVELGDDEDEEVASADEPELLAEGSGLAGSGASDSAPWQRSSRPDVERLHSASVREVLSEALVQVDATKQWHVVDLTMSDRTGTLSDLLEALESDPDGGERLEYSAALGVSFGGYAAMKLVIGGSSATDLNTGLVSERLRALGPEAVPYIDVASNALDVRNAPVRTVTRIFEVMAHIHVDQIVPQVASLAAKCHGKHLNLMLVHVPSSPPSGALGLENPRMEDPSLVWLRVRIGVPPGRWRSFLEVIRDVTGDIRAIDEHALVRVSSVAEFARPATGAQPGGEGREQWLSVEDRSVATGAEEVTFVFVDTPVRRGVMNGIFSAVERLPMLLRGASSYSMVGRSFTTLYFDGPPDPTRKWSIETQIRIELKRQGFLDPTTVVKQLTLPGWPGIPEAERARAGAGMRLVWQAPNVPGVLPAIMRTLHDFQGRPNTSYVLSRVSDVDVSLGRLVLRLEDVSAVLKAAALEAEDPLDGPDDEVKRRARELVALEDHARLLSAQLTRRLERLVQAGRDADPSRPLRERDVFVSTDLFRQQIEPPLGAPVARSSRSAPTEDEPVAPAE